MYNFTPSNLINWITSFCIFEIPLALFYLSISKKTDTVTDWYSGKTINIWNVVVIWTACNRPCDPYLSLNMEDFYSKQPQRNPKP